MVVALPEMESSPDTCWIGPHHPLRESNQPAFLPGITSLSCSLLPGKVFHFVQLAPQTSLLSAGLDALWSESIFAQINS